MTPLAMALGILALALALLVPATFALLAFAIVRATYRRLSPLSARASRPA